MFFLIKEITMDILQGLNDKQKEAVLQIEGPVLILAGAGSGKTTVLTRRIAYMIEQGIDAYNIIAITFTNKAAREMRERVDNVTSEGRKVWVSTFHSTCVRILRQEIDKIGYDKSFTIYDSDDSLKLVKQCCKELDVNDKLFPEKTVMKVINDQKDNLISNKQFERMYANDFRMRVYAQIYNLYQEKLYNFNALDFNDIIFKTVELFVKDTSVLEKYQERFKYIMVDEYQDTNTAQYELVKLLSAKYKNLCVVGDDDQSIYGWRGANIQNILDFEKDYKNTKIIKLEQNYRSTQVILTSANEVIKNNKNRKNKSLWTEIKDGDKLVVNCVQSDREEANYITNVILDNVKDDKYSDFAVLYRTNSQSRSVEDELIKKKIPYAIFGGVRFYDRKEIKDILAYLKLVNNINDELSLTRIMNVPKRGIGDTSVQKLRKYALDNDMSLYNAMKNVENIEDFGSRYKNVKGFVEVMEDIIAFADGHNVKELIEYIIKYSNYETELIMEGTDEAKNRIENIYEFLNKANEFVEVNPEGALAEFLEDVALVADVDGYTEQEEVVVLMTLHSSKGLEFPTVFLIGMEDNIFPSFRSLESSEPELIEEERRLCYVGITRAKRNLYLTRARSRMQHGRYVSNNASRFLDEIPSELIDDVTVAVKKIKQEPFIKKDLIYKPNDTLNSYLSNSVEQSGKSIGFEIGDTVRQMKYGKGTVKDIKPAGADFEVTVEFAKIGEKKFMAFLSKLKKVQ